MYNLATLTLSGSQYLRHLCGIFLSDYEMNQMSKQSGNPDSSYDELGLNIRSFWHFIPPKAAYKRK